MAGQRTDKMATSKKQENGGAETASATSGPASETLGFQAEVKQLLHLMVHSLYSHREIFLRELISNASDAADKLRFEAVSNPDLLAGDPELNIHLSFDPDARTITVADNGIGMTRDEVIRNLGTIAKSGTAEFVRAMADDRRGDASLIGQFGVGFYSSFIVADRVEVLTRRAGVPPEQGVRWASDGKGEFSVETVERARRGTEVILHLREDAAEFAEDFRLRTLIRRYSDHIAFPVLMPVAGDDDGDGAAEESVNVAQALWTRPRSEITDDEYKEFYRHVSHGFDEPLLWSHNKVEGKREFTMLLYLPSSPPFDLWNRESPRGLKLYVQRVFIMDDAEQFLPLYLRFVRGVVDSSDLSLNISREMLQQDANVDAIRNAVTKRVLDMLEKLAKDNPESYQDFWAQFGRVLKEGPAEDQANKDRICGLLRFSTTCDDEEKQAHSLAEYIARMPEDQDRIYYITADSFNAAKSSPQLEVFRKRGIEVLLLGDPIDEWVMGNLREFDGREFRDVRRGELDLDADKPAAAGEDDEAPGNAGGAHQAFVDRLRASLGDRVADVRTTDRLTESPACLAIGEHDMSEQMRRLMEAAGQPVPQNRPVFEINVEHPLMSRLQDETDSQRFDNLAGLLLDQASLAEGRQLVDPGDYVRRLNALLLELSA